MANKKRIYRNLLPRLLRHADHLQRSSSPCRVRARRTRRFTVPFSGAAAHHRFHGNFRRGPALRRLAARLPDEGFLAEFRRESLLCCKLLWPHAPRMRKSARWWMRKLRFTLPALNSLAFRCSNCSGSACGARWKILRPSCWFFPFERFLSEERGEWPDIDLDLPSGDQRERAIQYVYERYGRMGAAMTANVITYRGRSAGRDAGKVLGFDFNMLEKLTKLVSTWGYQDSGDTPERQFRDAGLDLRNLHIKKFCELYVAVQDLPRHLGQHSGGMVICQGQLDSVVPLEPAAMPGRVVVQWDKEDCADMGIIKVDLLGLGMM